MKKFLFGVREFAWIVADEVANWLYPYRNQLTPEEKLSFKVKKRSQSPSVSGKVKV